MKSIQAGSVNETLIATVYNTDWSVKTDLAFNTAGISIYIQRIGQADGSPMTLSAKATPATSHADGAFLNLGGGDISVDIPDAPLSGYTGQIRIYGTFTGGFIIGGWYQVVGYNPASVAVGALTSLGTNAPSNWINSAAIATDAITNDKVSSDVQIASVASDILAQSDITSGNQSYVIVNNHSGYFAIDNFLLDALVEIVDVSAGTSSLRWVVNHDDEGSGTTTRIDFDKDLIFTPVSGDIIKVHNATRFTSNVRAWRDGLPNVLVGGKIDSYDSNANTLLNDIPTVTEFNARTLPSADYFNYITDGVIVTTNNDKTSYQLAADQEVKVTKIGTSTVSSDGTNIYFPESIGTSTLSPAGLTAKLGEYGVSTSSEVGAVAAAVWAVGTRTITGGTISTVSDKTGYSLSQAFPSNFASLGINASGHISRVTLVDSNTDNVSAATIADAVWDEIQSGHTTSGTFGKYIDAAISSVSTGGVSAGDIADAVRTELATELGRIDVATSTRLATDGYTTPPTVGNIRTELATELGRIDVAVSTRSTFTGGAVDSVTSPVTVGTNNDKVGYSLSQSFPTNFASLGINSSGHISRVVLVDTTTTNTDMRGTNNALLAASYIASPTAATIADAVWDEAQSGHVTAGTFGAYVDTAISGVSTGGISAGDIADAVRTELATELGRIDATISTRSSSAEVSSIPLAVWQVTMLDANGIGTTGGALNASGASGDPWSTYLPGTYTVGMAGYLLGNINIDLSDVALESTSQSILSSISGNQGGEFF